MSELFKWEFELQPLPTKVEVHGELVPHPACQHMQRIFVKDGGRMVQCGTCGTRPGQPVSLLTDYPREFREAVAAFVEMEIGKAKAVVCPPRSVFIEDDDDE